MKRKSADHFEERMLLSSRMGIVGTHPAVFVRVASKGLTGYVTWKSGEALDSKGIETSIFRENVTGVYSEP
jgi:hypothetical protein